MNVSAFGMRTRRKISRSQPAAGENQGDNDPRRTAHHPAAERLLEREPPCTPERVALGPQGSRDVGWRGKEEVLDVEPADEPLPQRDAGHEDDDGREPVPEAPPDSGAERPARDRLDDGRAHK